MDEADKAAEEMERYLADRLRANRRPEPRYEPGICAHCGSALDTLRTGFCDDDCAWDWTRRQDAIRRTTAWND